MAENTLPLQRIHCPWILVMFVPLGRHKYMCADINTCDSRVLYVHVQLTIFGNDVVHGWDRTCEMIDMKARWRGPAVSLVFWERIDRVSTCSLVPTEIYYIWDSSAVICRAC
jgi:hypothetical protein